MVFPKVLVRLGRPQSRSKSFAHLSKVAVIQPVSFTVLRTISHSKASLLVAARKYEWLDGAHTEIRSLRASVEPIVPAAQKRVGGLLSLAVSASVRGVMAAEMAS